MSKTMVHNVQLTDTNVVFCYGNKTFNKYIKKNHPEDNVPDLAEGYAGLCCQTVDDRGMLKIVIGLSETSDIYDPKTTLVHELSHATTFILEQMQSDCDELRSHILHTMYQVSVLWLDKVIKEGK